MIPQELKTFIEQNCSGKEPSDIIMEAIGCKIEQLGVDADEVLAYVEECSKGPTLEQKAEAMRQAEAEVKRLAEAEAERLTRVAEAQAKAESDARNAEMAADKAKAAIAEADKARSLADEMKARERAAKDAIIESKAKKRSYMIFGFIVLGVIIACASYFVWLRTGRSAVDVAKDAAYNMVHTETIHDIDIDTSDVPSDDESVTIDPNGDVRSQLQTYYDKVSELSDGFYKIKKGQLFGIADAKGKVIQRPKFTRITTRNNKGLIKVYDGDKSGFLNIKGVLVVKPKYTKISDELDGLIPVEINGKHGFLSAETLEEVTPCIYDYVYAREGDQYKVKQGNKIFYLNSNGKLIK